MLGFIKKRLSDYIKDTRRENCFTQFSTRTN